MVVARTGQRRWKARSSERGAPNNHTTPDQTRRTRRDGPDETNAPAWRKRENLCFSQLRLSSEKTGRPSKARKAV